MVSYYRKPVLFMNKLQNFKNRLLGHVVLYRLAYLPPIPKKPSYTECSAVVSPTL